MVQVMIAIGLSGVLSLGVMKISENMAFIKNESEGQQEESELLLEMRLLLDNQKHCSVSLAGVPGGTPILFKKSDIDQPPNEGMDVELFQAVSDASGNVVGRTKRFTGNAQDTTPTLVKHKAVKIKKISLVLPSEPLNEDYTPASRHTDIGRLFVLIEKNKKQKQLVLPMFVTMSTDASGKTKILKCQSEPTADPCPALGMELDDKTGVCRYRKTEDSGSIAHASNYAGIYGDWTYWDSCTQDRMVCGIQTKVEDNQGGGANDDTSLNTVRLICCNSLPIGTQNPQTITSGEGPHGTWGYEQFCPLGTYANGYRMKQEPSQGKGVKHGDDDTTANGVEIICSDPAKTALKSKEGGWGTWGTAGYCPADQYICGMRTRVEPGQGGGDDTALNGLEVKCCRFKD